MNKIKIKEAIQQMSEQELKKWESSACIDCKYFNGFFTEERLPMYYNCQAHNTTGLDLVRDMFSECYCSFWKSKEQ